MNNVEFVLIGFGAVLLACVCNYLRALAERARAEAVLHAAHAKQVLSIKQA